MSALNTLLPKPFSSPLCEDRQNNTRKGCQLRALQCRLEGPV